MADTRFSDTILRARELVSSHGAVSHVGPPYFIYGGGMVAIDATFEVNLPNKWRWAGKSPSGVKPQEVVRFAFSSGHPGYPLEAQEVSLREDFNRCLPHMHPGLAEERRPVPCLYDGPLVELLHRKGLIGILNQMVDWLDRAAMGTLIDFEQGWEPVWRGAYPNKIVVDAEALRKLVDRNVGHRFCKLNYVGILSHGTFYVRCHITNDVRMANRSAVRRVFREKFYGTEKFAVSEGRSLALIVWPGQLTTGKSKICNKFLPETVATIAELKERAGQYGCIRELETGLMRLKLSLTGLNGGPFLFAIVLLVRRPCKVIGSENSIELFPYVLGIRPPDLFAQGESTHVLPALHLHDINRALLARMAGNATPPERLQWTLIGAGSLGSKLALHLARAGNGPTIVIDNSLMTPHNAARHALIPPSEEMLFNWMDYKAKLLGNALNGLRQGAIPLVENVVGILDSKKQSRQAFPKRFWAVVNATGSNVVREAIATSKQMPVRVIETSLLAGGTVGVITAEGPGRNPNSGDLISEFYALLLEDKEAAKAVFEYDVELSSQSVGQGCGTMTMVMSDGRLSVFAAAISEYLLKRQSEGLPEEGGEVLIGRSVDGMSLKWCVHHVPPVVKVETNNGEKWHVHIHSRAHDKIMKETARFQDKETGGVIIGRVSEASHTFHVVDVIDAPEDSSRKEAEFVLGKKGLSQKLNYYSERSGGTLYCLGTWHSHLTDCGPSRTDRTTGKIVSDSRLNPSVLLIRTPAGYHALLADAVAENTKGEA